MFYHYTVACIEARAAQVEEFVRLTTSGVNYTLVGSHVEISFSGHPDLLNELVAWLQAGRILSFKVAIVPDSL